jgi:membrane fusion protein, multidrug efflux system
MTMTITIFSNKKLATATTATAAPCKSNTSAYTAAKSFLVIATACAALTFSFPTLAKKPAQQQMPPAIVEVVKIQTSDNYDQLTATGNLIALPGVTVKSEIAGRITNIYFKSGDRAKAGTPLVEIYPDILKALYDQAKAEVELAQVQYDRMARLHVTHAISDSDYDKSKADLELKKGKIDEAKANLSQTIVRAPFDGKLGINIVSLGQYIGAGQDIVSLQSLNPIYVDFTIPEIYASKIAVGQNLNVRSDSYPKETFGGVVHAIDPLINKNTRSLTVRAAIANKEEKLLPGAFADVILFTSAKKQVIKIPQVAVVYDPNGNYVYKVADGKAVKTIVTLGLRDAQNVIVTDGLKIDDVVVTAGQMKITQDGAPVIVAPPRANK